jgi:hypothetical protein
VLLSWSGCSGGDRLERIPVRGTASVEGAPIAAGTISFLPSAGHSGPAATAVIENGSYQLSRDEGPVAGTHRVVVIVDYDDKAAFFSQAKKQPADSSRPATRRWESEVDVPEKGPFEYDVAVEKR